MDSVGVDELATRIVALRTKKFELEARSQAEYVAAKESDSMEDAKIHLIEECRIDAMLRGVDAALIEARHEMICHFVSDCAPV